MDRWRGISKVPLFPGSRSHYKVATSLCISSSSQKPIVPSMNAIFFNGDRVRGTGNPVIEKLSDLEMIAEIIVSKLGENCNVWVIEASEFNGPFAVYKDFIPSVNQWGEPQSYDPTGYPASTSTVSLLSTCLKEVKNTLSSRHDEPCCSEALGSCFSQPKTLLFGFSKGGTVVNQLVTELAFSEVNSNIVSSQHEPNIIPTSKESLFNSITEIHYVDVGLNSTGAYITDQDVIERISKRISERALGIRFVLHGTPRQWRDSMRVWIGKEEDTMVDLLEVESRKSGGKLSLCERFYFGDMLANMQMHFEVIENMDVS
ncbi:hypothetical protein L1987_73192 [Smallanthus sonchifolius]|uniref:Uncharacterized protein n=1 Tax=Smallanthus sonchifolius TaxID=185202 RepID=A0ACB9A4D3_9ASTR|nr:hypothetical protein L1987_73192 [Smallanthus sonchifolius]